MKYLGALVALGRLRTSLLVLWAIAAAPRLVAATASRLRWSRDGAALRGADGAEGEARLSQLARWVSAHGSRERNVHDGEKHPRVAVRKPKADVREYLHTTFSSGLRVLAVEDPAASNVGFAVAVEAGSLEDPPDFQGLAHFCEHMLFLGSEKYPDTEIFTNHLSLHGGQHNAYTASEETVYFNEIGKDGIEKALDIFAQFFISPSFTETMVDKEIHAVDSEHKKNMPDTQHRLWHLFRSIANPENPVHKFSTGNLQTLKVQPEQQGKDLVQALRKFHRGNYCSRRLHLVLVANMSTASQLELAHRHFDAVPVSTAESCPDRPDYTDIELYSHRLGNLGRRITLSTQGTPQMWLVFPVPPLRKEYKKLAEAYVWNALGHYGPGSLKAALLEQDLSQKYSFFAETSVAGSMLFLTFSLTEHGVRNTDRVMELFFAYLRGIRAAGVDQALLESLQEMHQVSFDYQETKASEFDFVSTLAGNLPGKDPADVLTAGVLIDSPDKASVARLLDSLVPSNVNVAVASAEFADAVGDFREKYYDFRYNDQALAPELVARLDKASGFGLLPPPRLAFVPKKLDLIREHSGSEAPEHLVQRGRVQMWWLGRAENIHLPKAVVLLKVGLPAALVASPEAVVLAALHARVVQQVLEQPADALQTCGLTYGLVPHSDGLMITFSGFDEHLLALIRMVLPRVRDTGGAGASAFERARRQLVLDLADTTGLQPFQHALEALEVVSVQGRFSRAELLAVARGERVNAEGYAGFLRSLFADAQLSSLVTGNVDRERAKEISEVVAELLGIAPAASGQGALPSEGHLRVVDLSSPVEVRVANPIPEDPNSATLISYQFGVPTIDDRVHLAMLGQIMDRPVFEALRTERQLGYVVFGYVAPRASIVEVRVLVQGFREGPDVVAGLIEETLGNLTKHIAALTPEEVAARRLTLRTELAAPPVTLAQHANMYWEQIWEGTYCFRKRRLELEALDASADAAGPPVKPLLDAWLRAVAPASSPPKKVAVKLFGAGAAGRPMGDAGDTGTGPITLLDSATVQARLKGERFWPHEVACQRGDARAGGA